MLPRRQEGAAALYARRTAAEREQYRRSGAPGNRCIGRSQRNLLIRPEPAAADERTTSSGAAPMSVNDPFGTKQILLSLLWFSARVSTVVGLGHMVSPSRSVS